MQISGVSGAYSLGASMGMFGKPGMGSMQGPPPPPPGANTEFSDVDSDGDGSVSESELESLLGSGSTQSTAGTGDDRTADLFGKIDSDSDGEISSTEWSAFQEKIKQGPPPPPPAADQESDDSVTAVLKSLVSQLYKSADANGDGQLSQDEVTGWMQQASPGATASASPAYNYVL